MSELECLQRAVDYVRWDPDPTTRKIMADLLEAKNFTEIKQLVEKRIQFGTAGLRAAMGVGYHRMNDLVVLQTCQGLCKYLLASFPDAREKV